MDFAHATKICLLLTGIAACELIVPRAHAVEAPTPLSELENHHINSVEDLAKFIWAVLDAIEREHVSAPSRGPLIEIVARALTGLEDGPELNAASAELIHCQNVDSFTEKIRVLRKGDHQNRLSLDQFQDYILKELEAKVGHLQLVREKDYLVENQFRNNRYVGIGVSAHSDGEMLRFAMVIPGGPAHRVGLTNGTIVEEIDGRPTRGVPIETTIDWLRGPQGTEVVLKVTEQGPTQQPRTVSIKRGVIRQLSIIDLSSDSKTGYETNSEDDKQIRWIGVDKFSSSTLSELRTIDAQSRVAGAKAIVLDFRGFQNADDLYQAQLVADGLLDGGTLWFQTEHGEKPRPVTADRECLFRGIPIVVILRPRTGAASIAIAAALQDAGRAVIVGDPPNFTGAFANTIKLEGVPFALKMQTAKLTRTRRDRRWPLQPDYPSAPNRLAVENPQTSRINNNLREQLSMRLRKPITGNVAASAPFPANPQPGIQPNVNALFDQASRISVVQPIPLVKHSTIDQIAREVARELCNASLDKTVE